MVFLKDSLGPVSFVRGSFCQHWELLLLLVHDFDFGPRTSSGKTTRRGGQEKDKRRTRAGQDKRRTREGQEEEKRRTTGLEKDKGGGEEDKRLFLKCAPKRAQQRAPSMHTARTQNLTA